MITTAAIAAAAETQLVRYDGEPTHTMPALHSDGTPCRVASAAGRPARLRAGTGQPRRAVTVALAVLVVLLLAAIVAAGSL